MLVCGFIPAKTISLWVWGLDHANPVFSCTAHEYRIVTCLIDWLPPVRIVPGGMITVIGYHHGGIVNPGDRPTAIRCSKHDC